MPVVSEHTLLISVIIATVLMFVSTIASVITAVLLMGFTNWLKISITETVHRIDNRQEVHTRHLSDMGTQLRKHSGLITSLYQMMVDASNTTMSGEEISKKIRSKIRASGVFKQKDEDIIL